VTRGIALVVSLWLASCVAMGDEEQASEAPAAEQASVAEPAPAEAEKPKKSSPSEGLASDLGIMIDPTKPMDIRAEEFEAGRSPSGGDIITFRRQVVAKQEDMLLRCDWLQAIYPPGGGNPTKISARGDVKLTQTGRELSCQDLAYDAENCRVLCTSDPAVVRRGEDEMRGREIELDLCKGTVIVRGDAIIQLKPAPPSQASE
jgi:lipopolysaccharide export system protein LptA